MSLVPFLGYLGQFDSPAMWAYPTNHPIFLDRIIWVRLPHRVPKQPNRIGAFLWPSVGPAPSRGQPGFRLASDKAPIAGSSSHVSWPAKATHPPDAAPERNALGSIGQ